MLCFLIQREVIGTICHKRSSLVTVKNIHSAVLFRTIDIFYDDIHPTDHDYTEKARNLFMIISFGNSSSGQELDNSQSLNGLVSIGKEQVNSKSFCTQMLLRQEINLNGTDLPGKRGRGRNRVKMDILAASEEIFMSYDT